MVAKKKKKRTCPVCEEGTISPVAEAGRIAEHHGIRLEIPADIEVPTCDHCGEQFFNAALAKKVDARLDEVLDERRHAIFAAALAELERVTTRGKLEKLLDWSPGYISKMLSRRKKVEHRTAVLFELIAEDPGRLTRVLHAFDGRAEYDPAPDGQ